MVVINAFYDFESCLATDIDQPGILAEHLMLVRSRKLEVQTHYKIIWYLIIQWNSSQRISHLPTDCLCLLRARSGHILVEHKEL